MTRKQTLSVAVLALLGCSVPQDPTVREFVIHVDSVEAPATVRFDEPLELKFYGTIGSNLCYAFDRFEGEQSGSRLELTLWGRSEFSANESCPTAISRLEGRSFVKAAPHLHPVTVVVHQPDGSTTQLIVDVSN